MAKAKIVLDADVLIHFSKSGYLAVLPQIFKEYDYIVFSKVYDECKTLKVEIDNICLLLKTMAVVPFSPSGEMLREYVLLTEKFGLGESACMAYCKFNHDVVGSSNLRDIKDYCTANNITYLTTLDFFYYAWQRGVMIESDIDDAICKLITEGHRLPNIKIGQYRPNVNL